MAMTTSNTAGTTYINKTYYERKLLENARTKFVYSLFGQKRGIPKNNGKKVEFRKWNLFDVDPNTQKLAEGTTPSAQSLSQTKVEATVDQYGAFVEVSDLLDMTTFDPIQSDAAELLGEQLGTVLDWVTRDTMITGASDQFANDSENMVNVTAANKLTLTEIRKAVRTLKKNKARMFSNGGKGHFVCIVDPDSIYDLQAESLWQDVSKYSNAEQIYQGELGRMFGVVFVESTEAKVTSQSVLNAVNANTTTSATFVLKNDPTDAEVEYLSTGGNKIYVAGTEYTLAATGSYTAATKTVKLSATASLSADAVVYSKDAGAPAATTYAAPEIHHTLIFGADAYGTIDIAGSGAIQHIAKPHGSSGTADPLNQRATIGAKISAYTAAVLNPLWIIDIQHAVS